MGSGRGEQRGRNAGAPAGVHDVTRQAELLLLSAVAEARVSSRDRAQIHVVQPTS